jgi:hypothetical protein
MNHDWQMPRRGEACTACQAAFEPGTVFNAYLYETSSGYERRDFCLRCALPAEPEPIGFWRTRRPQPTARKTAPFDREAVFAFFQRLQAADSAGQLQFRFVLALLLWRKKVLKFDDTVHGDNGEVWRFTQPQTHETYNVARPELDEAEIERLSNQLEQLLAGQSGELEPLASTTDGEATNA